MDNAQSLQFIQFISILYHTHKLKILTMKFKHTTLFFITALILLNACSNKESMNVIDLKTGETIGVLSISKHQNFVVVAPKIHSLPPGLHGFHLHQTNDCNSTTEGNKTILGGAAGEVTLKIMQVKPIIWGNRWQNGWPCR